MSFGQFLLHLHYRYFSDNLRSFGRQYDVLPYPTYNASYAVPVRLPRNAVYRGQYRLLQSRLLQCMGHPKPPCDLLMLPGVTPAHKGLTPSGLSFVQRTLLNLPFKAHTCNIANGGKSSKFGHRSPLQTFSSVVTNSLRKPPLAILQNPYPTY